MWAHYNHISKWSYHVYFSENTQAPVSPWGVSGLGWGHCSGSVCSIGAPRSLFDMVFMGPITGCDSKSQSHTLLASAFKQLHCASLTNLNHRILEVLSQSKTFFKGPHQAASRGIQRSSQDPLNCLSAFLRSPKSRVVWWGGRWGGVWFSLRPTFPLLLQTSNIYLWDVFFWWGLRNNLKGSWSRHRWEEDALWGSFPKEGQVYGTGLSGSGAWALWGVGVLPNLVHCNSWLQCSRKWGAQRRNVHRQFQPASLTGLQQFRDPDSPS